METWNMTYEQKLEEVYRISSPISVLRSTYHYALWRNHICSECFCPISIGERYACTVYKDDRSGKLSQYKVHAFGCPCPEEYWR